MSIEPDSSKENDSLIEIGIPTNYISIVIGMLIYEGIVLISKGKCESQATQSANKRSNFKNWGQDASYQSFLLVER